MRSLRIVGALVVLGLIVTSLGTVKLRHDPPTRRDPQVLRARARRDDGTLAGIVVDGGRLLEARLRLLDGRAVLTPPRWGVPVVDADGEVDPRIEELFDRLRGGRDGGPPGGVAEVELSVAADVPEAVRRAFGSFLARRGIRAVPWSDP